VKQKKLGYKPVGMQRQNLRNIKQATIITRPGNLYRLTAIFSFQALAH
jgi:hypothetical protein